MPVRAGRSPEGPRRARHRSAVDRARLENDSRRLLAEGVYRGLIPGGAFAVALDGEPLPPIVSGDAVRFGDDGRELPPGERIPVTEDTLFDLASLTKVVTAIVVMTFVDDGTLALDEPVGTFLPEFRSGAKSRISLRHLLTHTSGLARAWRGWRAQLPPAGSGRPPAFDRAALLADLRSIGSEAEPGERFLYSCVGYLLTVALLEQITGDDWIGIVGERVLRPLGLGLTFRPELSRTAATEFDERWGRGLVRGVPHDEPSWSLGGTSGNAGLFGTAADVLRLAERIRLGLPGILSRDSAEEMWRDQLPGILTPTALERQRVLGFRHGIGLRIGDTYWMGAAGHEARGHTGFTGTSFFTDRVRGVSAVLLSNRVHPTRANEGVKPLRRALADALEQH